MSKIIVTINGAQQEIDAGTSASEIFATNPEIVVVEISGKLKDLNTTLLDGDSINPITIKSPQGLNVLRHSVAHVLAQAVQSIFPNTKLGIGPYIEDGFYYDFDIDQNFTPEDLKNIDKAMKAIIKKGQKFSRRKITEEEARTELAKEPYKIELLDSKQNIDSDILEIGEEELTIYDNLHPKTGETIWKDLCRGPHLPNTKYIKPNAYSLTRSAAAYWRGNEKNPQLQRIYGTAWPNKEDLQEYQQKILEAEKRDHRKLGAALDLFSFPEELGSGLPVFHPKGGIIRKIMEDYSRTKHEESGYEFVYTPHITKGGLYETSGHLQWYKDGMFPAMKIDEETDHEGNVTKMGQDYYLKPMNCPMHNLIFASRGRSYRELPIRLFEFGSVYRYEKSGVIHGLTRVRGLTQDDAHIYCTRDQMKSEISKTLDFVLNLLKDYGLNDFYLEISTKDNDKFVGSEEIWEEATETLSQVAKESGLELIPDVGGAAFYGPKISVQAKDAIGRTWQMSTIQLDFNLPERFDLEYQNASGGRERPVMIHRALFGSVERFFGVLTEHYAGAFPAWLAPVQVIGIPVAEAFNDPIEKLIATLKDLGIRAETDLGSERFPKKIRNANKNKIPFTLIIGGEDFENNTVSFRYRDGSQENGIPIDEAIKKIVQKISQKCVGV